MVYVTGDLHGEYSRLLYYSTRLKKEDYLITTGEFGFVWCNPTRAEEAERDAEERILNAIEQLPFTLLVVDGNHENFDRLFAFEEVPLFGGTVRRIRDNIYYLERGGIYEIDGKRIFTFGGAASIDRASREEFVSWWHQEIPTEKEMDYALQALRQADFGVDYVVTHTAPAHVIERMRLRLPLAGLQSPMSFKDFALTQYFCELATVHGLQFNCWYFGHFHLDVDLRAEGKLYCGLMHHLVRLGETECVDGGE